MRKSYVPFLIIAILFGLVPVSVFKVEKAQALTNTYDLATSTNWNIRIDGAAASDNLSFVANWISDINNDGRNDLAIGAWEADNNSRTSSGSIYVIYSSLLDALSGTGNTLDLASSSSYNLRFDGATASDNLGIFNFAVADLDQDGKNDIGFTTRLGDALSRTDAGTAYVVYGSRLDDWTGTGNNIDLATSSNYNIRIVGATASDWLGRSSFAFGDLNNNGRPDIAVAARGTDYNSRSASGSLYVIYDSVFSGLTGAGNDLDMGTSTNWNLRFDGYTASAEFTTGGGLSISDITNDGRNDIIVSSGNESQNSRSTSGSAYIISNSIIGSFTGTGNAIDTASSSAWTLRIDGAASGDIMGTDQMLAVGDLDNDSKLDFSISSIFADNNSRTNSGSQFVFYNTLLQTKFTGTGNTLDLANSSSYNIRFDGTAVSGGDQCASAAMEDINNDGRTDFELTCWRTDFNSRSNSGSLFIFDASLLASWTGTGNNVDLATTSNYSLRYDGAGAGDLLGGSSFFRIADLNNDNTQDIVVGAYLTDNNSRADSGSLYIIYNFPHTLSVNQSRLDTSSTSPRITGSLSATSSTTTLSDIQYSLDNASPTASSWTSCTASDGSFNSTSESFTCALSFSSDATHNVFIRGKDSNGSYTPARRYGSLPLTVDRLALPTFSITAQQYSNDGSVTVNGTYNDDRSGLDNIQVKGIGTKSVTAGLSGASWSVTYANVPDGVYQLSAISYDRAGNEKSVTAGNTTTVDRAAPTLTASATNLTDKDNSSTVEQGVTIEGSVSDGYAGLKSVVLTNETTNSTIPLKVTNGSYRSDITLRKGTNNLKVVATDNAGNSSSKTLTIVRNSFLSSNSKDIPITDEKGITKKYKQTDVLNGLKQGKTNVFVRSLQDSLKTLGHYTGNITGFFGELTKKAVIAFQKSVGIKQAGTVQAQTLARLDVTKITDDAYLSSIAQSKPGLSKAELKAALSYQLTKDIKSGKQYEEVKFIQKKLYVLGYYTGAINGWLNTSTQTAISEFRKDRGLGAGGVDVKLREKLNNL